MSHLDGTSPAQQFVALAAYSPEGNQLVEFIARHLSATRVRDCDENGKPDVDQNQHHNQAS